MNFGMRNNLTQIHVSWKSLIRDNPDFGYNHEGILVTRLKKPSRTIVTNVAYDFRLFSGSYEDKTMGIYDNGNEFD